MNFWRSFSKKSALRQLLFAVVLFALAIPVAILDSSTQVKVDFGQEQVSIRSDRYNMTVRYEQIASAQLSPLAEPGEDMEDAFDNDILRAGKWHNDTWGDYYITADLDASNCIVLQLDDGRIFVFSRKNDTATSEDFRILQTHLK